MKTLPVARSWRQTPIICAFAMLTMSFMLQYWRADHLQRDDLDVMCERSESDTRKV